MKLTKGCLVCLEINDNSSNHFFGIYLGKKENHHLFLMNSIVWRTLYNYSIKGKESFMLFSPRYFDNTVNINNIKPQDRIWVKIIKL